MASKNKTPTIGKAVVDLWHTVTTDLFGTYHPERHYMRGSGPKCGLKESKPDAPSC